MPVDKRIVEKQLKALGDFYQFFTSKEIHCLPEILTDGETIYGITSGYYEGKTWIIAITDIRLIFLDKGMFYGLKQIDMPLSQISSVSHKTGIFFGEIEVTTGAGVAGTKTIGSIAKKDVIKICSILSGLIHRAKGGNSTNIATQLELLANLCEKGAITEEEFRLSKDRLLRG